MPKQSSVCKNRLHGANIHPNQNRHTNKQTKTGKKKKTHTHTHTKKPKEIQCVTVSPIKQPTRGDNMQSKAFKTNPRNR